MISFIQSLLIFQCMLFGNIENFYQYLSSDYTTSSYDIDDSEEASIEFKHAKKHKSKEKWAK